MLGTLTPQAKRLKAESLFSIEDLRARREEFEEAEDLRLRRPSVHAMASTRWSNPAR